MNTTSPAIQNLARQLIALEVASNPSDRQSGAAVLACGKLRVPLVKLVGVTGFRSLLSRALALAKARVPSLSTVQVGPDGSLEGLDGLGRTQETEVAVVVVAQLLGLLVTFIGEPLALRLVCDAWPDASVTEIDNGIGEGS